MTTFFDRFSLGSVKFNNQILICLIVIWMVVLICSISSILSQPFNRTRRTFWIALIIAFPLIGLLAYLPFSFKREELPQIFQSRNAKDKARHRKSRSS